MINLLPQDEKKILQDEEKKKISFVLEILGFVFFLCLALVLSSVKIYISGQAEAEKIIFEQEKKEFKTSDIKDLPEKIRLANKTFSNLNSFYKNQFKTTEALENILETIPEGIYLTSFSYQGKNSQVILSGFCEDREILFEFKKRIEQEGNFIEVFFPPSVWIKPTDIDFNLRFKIKNKE